VLGKNGLGVIDTSISVAANGEEDEVGLEGEEGVDSTVGGCSDAIEVTGSQKGHLRYRCRQCRAALFDKSQLAAPHTPRVEGTCTSFFLANPPPSETERGALGFNGIIEDTEKAGLAGEDVLEGLVRILPSGNIQDTAGGLACARCGVRVGAWSWVGLPCSCRVWECPAYVTPTLCAVFRLSGLKRQGARCTTQCVYCTV
jgi:hypothetical protein